MKTTQVASGMAHMQAEAMLHPVLSFSPVAAALKGFTNLCNLIEVRDDQLCCFFFFNTTQFFFFFLFKLC